jgi:hypothetical protein
VVDIGTGLISIGGPAKAVSSVDDIPQILDKGGETAQILDKGGETAQILDKGGETAQILDKGGETAQITDPSRMLPAPKDVITDPSRMLPAPKVAPKVPTNDSNRLHHIFGQPKHKWNLTGLDQNGNIKLMEDIANNASNLVRTKTIPNGKVEIYRGFYNGKTIEITVFENASGVRVISDGWVK